MLISVTTLFCILHPLASPLVHLLEILLVITTWITWLHFGWKRRPVRFTLLALPLLLVIPFVLPANESDKAGLRRDYAVRLLSCQGIPYYWGGESQKGLDCSGLIRRAMIDALLIQGCRHLDGERFRDAASLWWHDISATDFGKGGHGLCSEIGRFPSVNSIPPETIESGDLAVLGGHIMACLKPGRWIEAEPLPSINKVIVVDTPEHHNPWFSQHTILVRWNWLQ